jgi:septum formation topological specificity factor MinE
MQEILPKLHEEVVEALSKGLNSQPDKCHIECEHINVERISLSNMQLSLCKATYALRQ